MKPEACYASRLIPTKDIKELLDYRVFDEEQVRLADGETAWVSVFTIAQLLFEN